MERSSVRPPRHAAASGERASQHRRDHGNRASHARRQGIALVWVAIFTLVFVGIVGLGMDWGKVAHNAHELQNAADAGALAGALVVKVNPAGARQNAITIAFANKAEQLPVSVADNPANTADGEVVLGRWLRQEGRFIATNVAPNAVKVVGKRLGQRGNAPPLTLYFGPAFGMDTAGVSEHAIAWSRGSTGAGIIVLADDPSIYPGHNNSTGLLMDGGTVLDLRGVDPITGEPMIGDIQVNATSTSLPWAAFRLNGTSADIWAGEFNVVGATNPDADNTTAWESLYADPSYPFSVNPRSPRIEDPLAGLDPPNISTMPPGSDTTGKTYYDPLTKTFLPITIPSGGLTLNPGYYPSGIYMSSGSVVLNPGVYAFGGGKSGKAGLVVGGGSLIANGVMLYVTGDPSGSKTGTAAEYGKIDLGGNGEIRIISRGDAMTPPQIEAEMGIAIWQDRANPTYGRITGTNALQIQGTIYCGYNVMEVGGTANQTGNQIIAGALNLHGKVSLGVAYDGRNDILSYRSILVE